LAPEPKYENGALTPWAFEGDPLFHERQYTETAGRGAARYVPDAFTRPARTVGAESVEEVSSPGYIAGIARTSGEPGPSEMSWGRGNMAPEELATPSLMDEMQAVRRTNPADPGDIATYRGDREVGTALAWDPKTRRYVYGTKNGPTREGASLPTI